MRQSLNVSLPLSGSQKAEIRVYIRHFLPVGLLLYECGQCPSAFHLSRAKDLSCPVMSTRLVKIWYGISVMTFVLANSTQTDRCVWINWPWLSNQPITRGTAFTTFWNMRELVKNLGSFSLYVCVCVYVVRSLEFFRTQSKIAREKTTNRLGQA